MKNAKHDSVHKDKPPADTSNPASDFEVDVKRRISSIVVKSLLGVIFFLIGFNFSSSIFFERYPLFGVRFLAETLLSLVFAAVGFHTVPLVFDRIKTWVESLLKNTVSDIVWDFWEQQNKRMHAARNRREVEKTKQSKKEFKEKYTDGIFLDTSVFIDGRILDIVKSGFLPADKLIVMQSVLDELHTLSDSADNLKRQKGRRGLDILNKLKKEINVVFYKPSSTSKNTVVDKELVQVAKTYNSKLMTMDFNLNKVANARGIKVLNLNSLVEAIKNPFIPGEKIKVKIVQKGKEEAQGVGYMPDGTMIVVANAAELKGKTVEVVVSRLIQSPAGKMVFCELI